MDREMELVLGDVQVSMRNKLRELLSSLYPPERPELADMIGDFWSVYSQIGLTALPFAPDDGGLGGSAKDVSIVMEEIGRAVACDPYVSQVVLAGAIMRLAASEIQQTEILRPMTTGKLRVAAALREPLGLSDLSQVSSRVTSSNGRMYLNGQKSVVFGGDSAHKLIVSVREAAVSQDNDGSGISLFLIDAHSNGVTRKCYRTIDGFGVCELTMHDVEVSKKDRIGAAGGTLSIIEHAVDHAVAARCAEAVGAIDAVISICRNFILTRKSSGRPLASFETVRQKLDDMLVAQEQAKNMSQVAAQSLGSDVEVTRRRNVAAAAHLVVQSARAISNKAVEIHGKHAVSSEYVLGNYLKRLTAISVNFGGVHYHPRKHGRLAYAAE